jgi:hypothetical protein
LPWCAGGALKGSVCAGLLSKDGFAISGIPDGSRDLDDLHVRRGVAPKLGLSR